MVVEEMPLGGGQEGGKKTTTEFESMLDDILPVIPLGAVSRLPAPPVTVISTVDDGRPVGEPPPPLIVMDSRLRVTDRHLHPCFRPLPPPVAVTVTRSASTADEPSPAGEAVGADPPLPAEPAVASESHRSSESPSERSSPARTDDGLPGSPESSSELSSILTGDDAIERFHPKDYPPDPRPVRRRRFTKRPSRCRVGTVSGSLPRRGSGADRNREEAEFLASVLQEHPGLFADGAAATVRAGSSLASELMVASIQHADRNRPPPGIDPAACELYDDDDSDPDGLFGPSFTAYCSRA